MEQVAEEVVVRSVSLDFSCPLIASSIGGFLSTFREQRLSELQTRGVLAAQQRESRQEVLDCAALQQVLGINHSIAAANRA